VTTPQRTESVEFPGTPGTRYPTWRGYFSSAGFTNRHLEFAVINDLAIFEGDIVLGPAEDMPQAPDPMSEGLVIAGARYRWPARVVPYTINPSLPDQQRVHDAIAHWQARTAIRFVARTDQADYVTFQPGAGCSSSVGRRGGRQFITLGRECSTGNAIHEIGHTVGLWHEQGRHDRETYVTIVWSNILVGYEHNFDQQISDGTDVGAYDFGSIMHYPAYAFARDPSKKTIITKKSEEIGQRTALSDGDIAAVASMYPNA
jgi:hypothetical protein